ncbi:hypothetical protein O181_000256 [Austropuccinia psidii MF-1]|uniref:Uncharacterized protein n=1 Tax=Austropuccinia psidii MF-1 TaxID=1389203 RepID=A0A9Q3GBF4_9BASI|nr:hypothetical protein [Austropuccinia psidii MF-1]
MIWLSNSLVSLDLDLNLIALDIFQFQLLTCAITLRFIPCFLLYEWITPADTMRLAEDEIIQNHHQYSNQIHHHIKLQADSTIKSHNELDMYQALSNLLQLSIIVPSSNYIQAILLSPDSSQSIQS